MTSTDGAAQKGLTRKVVAGAGWSSLSTAGRQILSLACVGVLARKLGPGAYGLMAMANVVMAFLLNFRDLGTATAVIQKQQVSRPMLSSLFWVNSGIGLMLTLLVFGSSWPMAAFFHEPRLVILLQALSVSFVVTSAGVVHNAVLARNMAFRSIAIVDIASAVGGYVVAIPCAFAGFGVWSLVLANLTNALVATAGYWWLAHWVPRLEFSKREIRSIAGFSLNLSGFGMVNYFSRNADNIVVGRFLGGVPLGFYQMAYTLMLYPIQNISGVIGQVLLPAFSRIQEDNERFRAAYVKSCMLIGLVTFPVMLGMAVLADPLVRTILGPKWIPTIRLFQILAPVGLVQSIQGSIGHIYVAKGRTDWMFRWSMAATLVLIICFFIGVRYGITGVAISYFIGYFCILSCPAFLIPFRLIDLSFGKFARSLWPQFGIALAMAAVCEAWLQALAFAHFVHPWAALVSTSLLGILLYVFLMVRFRPTVILYLEEAVGDHQSGAAGRCLKAIGLFPAS